MSIADLGLDLDLDRIAAATKVIDPVFLDSPQYVDEQLADRVGRRVLVKVETLNPLRSFKGRGADFHISDLAEGQDVVCASGGGNFGQAVAYAARRHGRTADVFVPEGTSPVKLRRIAAFGARVHLVDGDHQAAAAAFAGAAADRVYVVDGRDTGIAEGAGTIGVELMRDAGFDTVVVPVGDGALISGVAYWIKAHAPEVRIIGAGVVTAPALVESWRRGEVVTAEPKKTSIAGRPPATFAAGIAIARPYPEAVRRTRALVDDMVLVAEDELLEAMHLAAETLGVLLEPAGAAGLAAIAGGYVGGGALATVLTGGNADLTLYRGAFSDIPT